VTRLGAVLLLAAAAGASAQAPFLDGVVSPLPEPPVVEPADSAQPPEPQIDEKEAALARKVARMLLVGVRGSETRPGDDFERFICGLKVGGILLFDSDGQGTNAPRNILHKRQLTRLTGDLQALAERCGDAPLFIAADVEGGRVNRIRRLRGFANIPSHRVLGGKDPRITYEESFRIGKVMAETGLNWDLAPVVDVDINPRNPIIGRWGRSFSKDPETVAAHARAFIGGLRDNGILSCVKHFPGHGSSTKDTHKALADTTRTAKLETELLPYRILDGEGALDCVMTAHLRNTEIDPVNILTVSSSSIEGILREDIGFQGLVLSDDLQMGAIQKSMTLEEAAVRAVRAGTDMLTLSNNLGDYDAAAAERVHAAIVAAVQEGRIPDFRIDEADTRILLLKAGLETGI